MTKRKTINKPEQLIKVILNEYDEQCDLFEEFKTVTERLILDLLKSNNLRVHSVTSRVKDKKSISDKIKKAGEDTYQCLDDIYDVCGNRIITYLPDEVDAVAEIIQNEFTIDYNLSVDKRTILDPDRFGYLSLHYIAKLSPKRLRLTEYKRFKKCKTEIQIRSILQHTWAEIEHDLGYKSKLAVPRDIRRRFSQLAGLLELADDTFVQIRDTLADYESNIADRIKKTPESVHIDQASLLTFAKQSKILHEIGNEIASNLNATLTKKVTDSFVITQIPRLDYIGIKNIAELSECLNIRKDDLVKLGSVLLGKDAEMENRTVGHVFRSAGILYVFYLLLLDRARNLTTFAKELIKLECPSNTANRIARILFYDYKQK